jgi:isocitrate dehydrogenase (NAD+)
VADTGRERRAAKDVRPVRERRPALASCEPAAGSTNVDIVLDPRETPKGCTRDRALHHDRSAIPRAAAESTPSSPRGLERIIRYAFDYAKTHGRKKVTLVHKANILKTRGGSSSSGR